MDEPSAAKQGFATVGGILGAAGGWLFSRYVGASMWIPALVSILLLVVFAKTPVKPKHFGAAIAVTLAHVAWFVAAGALTGVWEAILLDAILLSLAAAAVWARPSMAIAAVLGAIQLASLAYNVFVMTSAAFGTEEHKALSVHVTLRIIVLVALAVGVRRLRGPGAAATDRSS